MRIDAYTHFFPKKFFDKMLEVAGQYKDMGKRCGRSRRSTTLMPAIRSLIATRIIRKSWLTHSRRSRTS